MLVFVEEGKLENPEKNPRSKARTNNKLNPHMTPGLNRTRATLVGGDRSHCARSDPRRTTNLKTLDNISLNDELEKFRLSFSRSANCDIAPLTIITIRK